MSYSFKSSAPREGTNAEKYTLRKELFSREDVIPVWVADMDIDTPSFVLEAVKKRLEHPIVGYEEVPRSAFVAQAQWMKTKHGVMFEPEDFIYSHSVVASMSVAIEAFSDEGDKVIVQTPVYPPFFQSVKRANREVLFNPLKEDGDLHYTFDIEDLKSKIDDKTKLLLLCSPHNPVGRVWRQEELKQIMEVCLKHNIVVFADEIHSDLVYAPHRHIPFASLSKEAREITITAIGVGKTFNMAGFAMSSVVIQNKELKERFLEVYERVHFAQGSVLSHVAFESAYKEGSLWLEDLKKHLHYNYERLCRVCQKYGVIKVTPIEATYLAWLDCSAMGLRDKEIREFFIQEANLGLNAGLSFGRSGSKFMRLNFAVSDDRMSQILELLENALEKRFGDK